jgi:hypothetical protein
MRSFMIRTACSQWLRGLVLLCLATPGQAQPNVQYAQAREPFLFLVRESAVWDELKLTAGQRTSLESLNTRWDGALLASRNLPADKASDQFTQILTESKRATTDILDLPQRQRLDQIRLQVMGTMSLQLDPVAQRLELAAEQRQEIARLLSAGQEQLRRVLESETDANRRQTVEEEIGRTRRQLHDDLIAVLTPQQKSLFHTLHGSPFDLSRLGHASFKAPEFLEADGWINASPQRIADLRGEVIALHFWTYG